MRLALFCQSMTQMITTCNNLKKKKNRRVITGTLRNKYKSGVLNQSVENGDVAFVKEPMKELSCLKN